MENYIEVSNNCCLEIPNRFPNEQIEIDEVEYISHCGPNIFDKDELTKLSQLENDMSFIIDDNYVHTDNNYTDKDKRIVSDFDDLPSLIDEVNSILIETREVINDALDATESTLIAGELALEQAEEAFAKIEQVQNILDDYAIVYDDLITLKTELLEVLEEGYNIYDELYILKEQTNVAKNEAVIATNQAVMATANADNAANNARIVTTEAQNVIANTNEVINDANQTIEEVRILITDVNILIDNINSVKNETIAVKDATNLVKNETIAVKDATNLVKNETIAVKDEALNVIDEARQSINNIESLVEDVNDVISDASTATQLAIDAATNVKDGKTPIIGNITSTSVSTTTPASFKLINSGTTDVNGNPIYTGDIEIPIGKDGKAPHLENGITETLEPNESAYCTVVEDGTTVDGRPKYKISLGIPKGKNGLNGDGSGNVVVINNADGLSTKQYVLRPVLNGDLDFTIEEFDADGLNDTIIEYINEQLLTKGSKLNINANSVPFNSSDAVGEPISSVKVADDIEFNSIPLRTESGQVRVSDPLIDSDATTKKYVDELISTKGTGNVTITNPAVLQANVPVVLVPSASSNPSVTAQEAVVGGRNLSKNYNSPSVFNPVNGSVLTKLVVEVPEWGATDANRIVSSGGTSPTKAVRSFGIIPEGLKRTASVWVKNNSDKILNVFSNLGNLTINIAPSESQLVIFRYPTTGNVYAQIQFRAPSVSDDIDVTWWRIMYEEGHIPSTPVPAVEDMVAKSDVVNNLTSTSTDVPLSANQGKVLQDTKGTKLSIPQNGVPSKSTTGTGEPNTYTLMSSTATNDSLVLRTETGKIKATSASENNDVIIKSQLDSAISTITTSINEKASTTYVNEQLSLKGSKLNIPAYSVPYNNSSAVGEPISSLKISTDVTNSSIPQRTNTGKIKTAKGTEVNDCINFEQFTEELNKKLDKTEIIPYTLMPNSWEYSPDFGAYKQLLNNIIIPIGATSIYFEPVDLLNAALMENNYIISSGEYVISEDDDHVMILSGIKPSDQININLIVNY